MIFWFVVENGMDLGPLGLITTVASNDLEIYPIRTLNLYTT